MRSVSTATFTSDDAGISHLTVAHYTLLVCTDGHRYLLRDPSLGGEIWMTREAFDREATGYALVVAGGAPGRWRVWTGR